MIPVGGTYTIDATQAKEYIEKINPKIALLMHFKPNGGNIDVATKEEIISNFKNAVEIGNILEITVESMKNDKEKILIMERTGERYATE